MKIAIIGNAGSGKSTLAATLHKMLNIPLYHLDQYFWKPGWIEPDRTEFEKIHNALCDKPVWIIEGMAIRFFAYRIQKADIIIFVDRSRYVCLYRVLKRAFKNHGSIRSSSAIGCPERLPDLKFLKFIWNFPHNQKKQIELLCNNYKNQKKIFAVKNEKQLQEILLHLSTRPKNHFKH